MIGGGKDRGKSGRRTISWTGKYKEGRKRRQRKGLGTRGGVGPERAECRGEPKSPRAKGKRGSPGKRRRVGKKEGKYRNDWGQRGRVNGEKRVEGGRGLKQKKNELREKKKMVFS